MSRVIITADQTAELAHSGRKGMKWYQHIFGEQDDRAEYNKHGNGDNGGSRAYNKHNISEATDEELRQYVARKNLERQYLKEAYPDKPKSVVRQIMDRAGSTLIQKIGDEIGNDVFNMGKNFVSSAFGSGSNTSSQSSSEKTKQTESKPKIEKKNDPAPHSAKDPNPTPKKYLNDSAPEKKKTDYQILQEATRKAKQRQREERREARSGRVNWRG